jgi:hypothetical protein
VCVYVHRNQTIVRNLEKVGYWYTRSEAMSDEIIFDDFCHLDTHSTNTSRTHSRVSQRINTYTRLNEPTNRVHKNSLCA